MTMNIEDLINAKLAEAEFKQAHKVKKWEVNKARDVEELPAAACCGNCANISYHGIMEVKLEYGDCEAYKLSNRFCTKPESLPCEFWRKRSPTLMINERSYSREVLTNLAGMNATIRSGGRTLDSVKIDKVKRPKVLDEDKPKKRTAAEALALLGIGIEDEFEDAETVEVETEDENDG